MIEIYIIYGFVGYGVAHGLLTSKVKHSYFGSILAGFLWPVVAGVVIGKKLR